MSDSNLSDGIKNGRPFLFTDPKELAMSIQQYFDAQQPRIVKRLVESGVNNEGHTVFLTREVMTEQMPLTVTGLALHLGVSRLTLLNYRDPDHYDETIKPETRQEIINTIEKAYQRVEEYNEQKLFTSGLANGVKFGLTNNFGWIDKSVVDTNVRPVKDELDELDAEVDDRDKVAEEAKKALEQENKTTETVDEVSEGETPRPAPTQ